MYMTLQSSASLRAVVWGGGEGCFLTLPTTKAQGGLQSPVRYSTAEPWVRRQVRGHHQGCERWAGGCLRAGRKLGIVVWVQANIGGARRCHIP